MGLQLLDLDDRTRAFAIEELDEDELAGRVYLGEYLDEAGRRAYPALLREALEGGDDDGLAVALQRVPGAFKAQYRRRARGGGGFTMARVPHTAAQMLAEGEFNRYYIRGLCRALTETDPSARVEVYRARHSSRPRFRSEGLVGRSFAAAEVLADLREHVGEKPSLLPEINSGLSVRAFPAITVD